MERIWGRAGPDNATLAGVVDQGTALPKASLSVKGDELRLTIQGKTRILERKSEPVLKGDPDQDAALKKGVTLAFLSAVRTNNKAAVEALLTPESFKVLSQVPEWFEKIRNRLQLDKPELANQRVQELLRRDTSWGP